MAIPDRERLVQVIAKLMEQQEIVVSKPGPLFTELMDFHSPMIDRVSIPRQCQYEREQFPVNLNHLEGVPVVTGRSFNYYVIDDPIPEIDPNTWDAQLEGLTDLQRYYQNPRTWGGHLGDPTCENNAKSSHLRCAVNPCGPCEGCKDYQPGVGGGGGAL